MNDILRHSGTPHAGSTPHSGRYPWGSGEKPFQRYMDFYSTYNRLKSLGWKERDIAEKMGVVDRFGNPSVRALRAKYSNATAEKRAADRAEVLRLKDAGLSNVKIGERLGIGESTVRSLLDEGKAVRNDINRNTAKLLKDYVDQVKYLDIGPGVEIGLGISRNRIDNAIALLEEDGYKKQFIQIDQMGTDHKTTITVLTPPDVTYNELSENRYDIRTPDSISKVYDSDGNISKYGLMHPQSVDSSRILIRYNQEGGVDKDGLIELRRGVEDISLGNKMYAQVRIGVDDTHYLKGMAMYTDDIPKGYDIVFNTNKDVGTPPEKVFKQMKMLNKETGEVDWDNPFGASVSQRDYIGKDGKKHLSALNIVREEGEWQTWSKNLASQFLSKQPIKLAERQLDLAYRDKKLEFDEICALTNPAVKRKLLTTFADNCDSTAVDLKAAPFAGQQSHVILPFPKLKDNEIYAPNYPEGTRVALVRYPHGGTFEIPELTVRNRGSVAEASIRNAPDAVGINSHVAARLSGADFDGDTVIVIPLSDKVRVRSTPPLEGLKGFDPQREYPKYDGMKVISAQRKQTEMGKVSNLITDMTIKGAKPEEIAKAVRHSMVVIDAEKHELDYKRSEKENDIPALKKLYQDNGDGKTGASTIISRASSEKDIFARKDWRASSESIDPVTGQKIFKETGETYKKGKLKNVTIKDGGEVIVNTDKKTGKLYYLKDDASTGKKVRVYVEEGDFSRLNDIRRTQKSTKMAEATDAYTLTSGGSKATPGYAIEKVYAEYANNMKALGNAARKEWLNTAPAVYDKSAAVQYKDAVASLNKQLAEAEANAPRERQAQLMANHTMSIKKHDNPDMTKDEVKKYKGQAIVAARDKVGAKKKQISISDYEWKAIQAGAISNSKLNRILDNADLDVLRQKATPRGTRTVSSSMKALAKSMEATGYTTAQIADRLGVSASTVYSIVSE